MIVALFSTQTANAYVYTNHGPSGDDFTYHICDGNFTVDEESELQNAANAWDAGAGEVLRGALWNFIRGSDITNCGTDNGDDEVYTRSQSWFDNHGGTGQTIGLCVGCVGENGINDRDVVLLDDDGVAALGFVWSTKVASAGGFVGGDFEISIGQAAMHEFGHLIGFSHEQYVVATMNSNYPEGGDISAFKYRIQEDDYTGLKANHSDASTGRDLMLGRFSFLSLGSAQELWADDGVFANDGFGWTQCQEIVQDEDGPSGVMAIIEGTACQSPFVDWWVVSDDDDCDAGVSYPVGSRHPTICSGTPYQIGPNPYDFRNVPVGDYKLCAQIDPDDLISETDDLALDNQLGSENVLHIESCP